MKTTRARSVRFAKTTQRLNAMFTAAKSFSVISTNGEPLALIAVRHISQKSAHDRARSPLQNNKVFLSDAMIEHDYQCDLSRAKDGADIPMAPGDKCSEKGCAGILLFDAGSRPNYDEPETEPSVFCPDCGCEYLPDYERLSEKGGDAVKN